MKEARILVVEDDVERRSDFIDNLRTLPASNIFGHATDGYEIDEAGSQEEADTFAASRAYELVLLDLRYPMVPGGDVDEESGVEYPGMKWLPELRRMQPTAAIVVLTSWAYEDSLQNAVASIRDYHANDFVPKTDSFQNIIHRIILAVSNARQISRLDRLTKEYRSLLRSRAARTYTEDVGARLEDTSKSLTLLAKQIEGGDTSAIEQAPDKIRAELRVLGEQIREVTRFLSDEEVLPLPVDVVEIVTQILECHEDLAYRTKSEIEAPPAVSGLGEISTYRSDLKIAIHEVIVNALEALEDAKTPPGKRKLTVDIRQENVDSQDRDLSRRQIVIRIRDNGNGFQGDIEKVFEPGHSTRGGTEVRGIGLYIARRMMLSMGGAIQARNGTDGGAEIVLIVPDLAS